MTTFERFRAKYDPAPGGCWEWTGSRTQGGYGSFWFDIEHKQMPAHRAGWMLLVGPIRAGYDLDHLCRNRACVNPAHLEEVTRRENLMRGDTLARAHHEGRHCGSETCRNCRNKVVVSGPAAEDYIAGWAS